MVVSYCKGKNAYRAEGSRLRRWACRPHAVFLLTALTGTERLGRACHMIHLSVALRGALVYHLYLNRLLPPLSESNQLVTDGGCCPLICGRNGRICRRLCYKCRCKTSRCAKGAFARTQVCFIVWNTYRTS